MDGTTVFDEKDSDGGITELTYTDGAWKTDKLAFWEKNKSYKFYATSVKTGFNTTTKTISDVSVVQVIDNDADPKLGDDILEATATVNVAESNASPVELKFKHTLSRFSVYAYTDKADKNVTIKSLKLYMPKADVKDTYTFGTGWTTDWKTNFLNTDVILTEAQMSANENYAEYVYVSEETTSLPSFDNETLAAAGNPMHLGKDYFIVPTGNEAKQGDDKLQLYMKITYSQMGDDKTVFAPIQDLHSFTTGYQTNLYICVTSRDLLGIKFSSMTVNEWIQSDDHNQSEW